MRREASLSVSTTSSQTASSVSEALRFAAVRGERLASQVRLVIVSLAAIQFLHFNRVALLEGSLNRFHFILLMLLGLLGASVGILRFLRKEVFSANVMRFSVVVDGLAVFLVTAPTAYFPMNATRESWISRTWASMRWPSFCRASVWTRVSPGPLGC